VRFGPIALAEAEGAILAHSIRHSGGTIKKGVVLSKRHLDDLAKAGIGEVVVARLDPGDVHRRILQTLLPLLKH